MSIRNCWGIDNILAWVKIFGNNFNQVREFSQVWFQPYLGDILNETYRNIYIFNSNCKAIKIMTKKSINSLRRTLYNRLCYTAPHKTGWYTSNISQVCEIGNIIINTDILYV